MPGSGELLRAATVAFTSPARALVTAAPTFEAPGRAAESIGSPVRSVPVTTEGRLDLAAMAAKAEGAGLFSSATRTTRPARTFRRSR